MLSSASPGKQKGSSAGGLHEPLRVALGPQAIDEGPLLQWLLKHSYQKFPSMQRTASDILGAGLAFLGELNPTHRPVDPLALRVSLGQAQRTAFLDHEEGAQWV